MSVAFSAGRKVVPGADSMEGPKDTQESNVKDSHGARCPWSFCSGQDNELSSFPDEGDSLIKLREVQVKYGSQPIEGDSDTEEERQSSGMSESAWEKAGGACKIAGGLAILAGVVAATSWTCLHMEKKDPGFPACTYLWPLEAPAYLGALGMTAVGVKQLVDAYRGSNNTQRNPSA